MAVPTSKSQFGGLLPVITRGVDGLDLVLNDNGLEKDPLDRILQTINTIDAGFQGTPEQYEIWIAQQLQAAHDQVWLSSDLKAVDDPMGDLKPGFWRETSSGVYTEVPEDQAVIIVEGNGPSRIVTVRGVIYSVTWDGSEYVLTQRRL